MTEGPTRQANDPKVWQDDKTISDNDEILRVAKTKFHIVQSPDGAFTLSSQLWTSQKGGCSCELRSLYERDGHSANARTYANNGFGAAIIGVGKVRKIFNRIGPGPNKDPYEPLGIAYTPISKDDPHGPNPYHCDIFPKLGQPGSRKLHDERVIVFLDQNEARRLWEEKHNING